MTGLVLRVIIFSFSTFKPRKADLNQICPDTKWYMRAVNIPAIPVTFKKYIFLCLPVVCHIPKMPSIFCENVGKTSLILSTDWSTRVKQIAKLWRKASSQDRAPYVVRSLILLHFLIFLKKYFQ